MVYNRLCHWNFNKYDWNGFMGRPGHISFDDPLDFLITSILVLMIYERENKHLFSLELSHIQFIDYLLHTVDLFHISCHDMSIVITSLLTRTKTHLLQYYVSWILLIIACVYRHLTVFWLPLLLLYTNSSVHWSQRYVANALSLLLINNYYKRFIFAYSSSLACLQPMRRE
jgi:hypothetical protein